jgi:hypothetical protein
LLIIDTLRALHPEAEGENSRMGQLLQKYKRIARETRCAILLIHHTRKPGEMGSASLERSRTIEWLNEAAGARALINQTNARIGLQSPGFGREDVALLMKSHVKLKGESGLIYLERVLNPDGDKSGTDIFRSEQANSRFCTPQFGSVPKPT